MTSTSMSNCFNNRIQWQHQLEQRRLEHGDRQDSRKNQFNKIWQGHRGLNKIQQEQGQRPEAQPAGFQPAGQSSDQGCAQEHIGGAEEAGQTGEGWRQGCEAPVAGRRQQGGTAAIRRRGQSSGYQKKSAAKKPAGKRDARSKKLSPMGDINRGQKAKKYSKRGDKSMGGGCGGYNHGGWRV